VKLARTIVSTTPGLSETLAGDWQKAARFYAKFGVTDRQYCLGVPALDAIDRLEQECATDDLVTRKSGYFQDVEHSVGRRAS